MVNSKYKLFTKLSNGHYFFNINSDKSDETMERYKFIGKIFAVSILKGYFLCPNFSILVYKIILGEKIEAEDFS